MTDETPPSPRLSAADSYLKHLTMWQIATGAVRDEAKVFAEGEIKFAELILKNLTLANAGGLLAIPAAVSLFNAKIESDYIFVIITAVAFAIGIVLSIIASICGYFTLSALSESHGHRATSAAIKAQMVMNDERGIRDETLLATQSTLEIAAEKEKNAAFKRRKLAIWLALFSLFVFLIGSGVGVFWALKKHIATEISAATPKDGG